MILTRKGDILTDSEIADLTGVDRRRVYELRKALTETRDPRQVISRAPRAQMASRKVRSMEFIGNIRGILEATPDRSFRSMAKELNVSHATIISLVNEDLRCKSYRMQTGQFLSEAMKARRLLKSVKLLNKLKHPKDLACCGSSLMRRISVKTRSITGRTTVGLPCAPRTSQGS